MCTLHYLLSLAYFNPSSAAKSQSSTKSLLLPTIIINGYDIKFQQEPITEPRRDGSDIVIMGSMEPINFEKRVLEPINF